MSNLIDKIEYFPAGSCSSHTGLLFKGIPNRKQIFPAGVFLIQHREKGYILYDTGYHPDIKKKARYTFYRMATPVEMTDADRIDHLLQKNGVSPKDIRYVILSHLHPDHIGGAAFFPQAKFILTPETYQVLKKPTLKDLVFKKFLPDDLEERLDILEHPKFHSVFPYEKSWDLFGDGSMLIVSIGGHARGQACLYLPDKRLFIGADLSWGIDFLPYSKNMKFLPSLVQINQSDYQKGIGLLEELIADGNQVVVSHDPKERIEGILHAL